jgi:NAD(P)-dependent dehydrogenase (short-subunit alcohol dehydrogenase family)
VKCDVTSWKDQLAVFKAAIANSPHKSIDIVIANAGIAGNDPVFEQGKMFQIVVGM